MTAERFVTTLYDLVDNHPTQAVKLIANLMVHITLAGHATSLRGAINDEWSRFRSACEETS